MRAFLPVTILLLSVSCQRSSLVSAEGVLRAQPARVGFGEAWLRSTVHAPLHLSNTGRTSLTLSLTASAPFSVPAELELGGAESADIDLTFAPTILGPVTGVVAIQTPNGPLTVILEGTGIPTPACDSTICRDAHLDPVTLECVLSPKADGAACTDGCLVGACSKGACLGNALSCDDGDRCTTDACAPDLGCVHVPLECPSSNPCLAGSCSNTLGCVDNPVVDGTACGAADCVTAEVCVSGQCVSRAVPDGAACGEETVCRPRGVCTASVCVQAPAAALTRAWNYAAPPGGYLLGLVADDTGNYFTAECHNVGQFRSQCALVSFDAAGAERWRTPFTHESYTGTGALTDSLMIAGGRVISTIGPSWVDAFDAASGAHDWSVDTHSAHFFPKGDPDWVRMLEAAYDGVDQLVLLLEGNSVGSIGEDVVVALSANTGALRHTLPFPRQGFSFVLDRSRNLYLGHSSGIGVGSDTITSFDPTSGRLKGSVDIGLRLNGEGLAKQVLGSFDVTLSGE